MKGFRLVFESDKLVFMKNNVYADNEYMTNDLFRLNVMTIIPKTNNKNNIDFFGYVIECSYIWNGCLS